MTFGTGRTRRRPFPYDVLINGTGFMLAKPKTPDDPELIGAQPDPMNQAAPITYGYSSQNPSIEATQGYADLSGGFGQRIQGIQTSQYPGTQANTDTRYRFASNMDLSIAGQMVPGPLITSATPGTVDSTNGIQGFHEIGGTLYALNGRYCQYRANDTTWTVSNDFGSGKVATESIVVKQNLSGATQYAFVAMGDGTHFWYHDAASTTTTWTQHGTMDALSWAQKGDFHYLAHDVNNIRRVDLALSPITEGNYGATSGWRFGDYSFPITRLALNAAGTLVILKQASLHVTDQDSNDIPLYPGMKWPASSTNGKLGTYLYENDLYVTYGNAHYRIDPSLNLEPVGPERFESNDTPVHGFITAGVGTPFCAFEGLYNPDNGHSYLLRYGAYGSRFAGEGDPRREDAWHGSLSNVDLVNNGFASVTTTFSSRKITAMYRSTIGADTGHERVYIGCSDGTIHFFQLPCTANPLGCSSYSYTAAAAKVFFPFWHAGFAGDEKVVRAVSVTATSLGTHPTNGGSDGFWVRSASSDYSTFPYTSYDPGGTAPFAPGHRWPVGQTVTLGDFAFGITRGSSATVPPVITNVGVQYRVNPLLQIAFQLNIVCENGQRKRNGVKLGIGADKIRALLKTVVNTTAGVTVLLPDESTQTCQFSGYTERMIAEDRTGQWRSVVTLIATQSNVLQGANYQNFSV